MKRYLNIAIAAFIIILFGGCGSFNIGTETKIDKNGSGDISWRVTYDGIFKQAAGQNKILSKDNSLFSIPNVQINQYFEGDKVVEEAKAHFKNLDELNKLFVSKDPNKDTFTISIKVDKGLFKNIYTYELKLPKDFSLNALTTQMSKNTTPGEIELFKPEDVSNFLGSAITFSNTVALPGKVNSNNATRTEGNKLSWDYTLSQIDPSKPLTASYEIVNTFNIIATVIAALIVIFLTTFLILRNKRKITDYRDTIGSVNSNENINNDNFDESKSEKDNLNEKETE